MSNVPGIVDGEPGFDITRGGFPLSPARVPRPPRADQIVWIAGETLVEETRKAAFGTPKTALPLIGQTRRVRSLVAVYLLGGPLAIAPKQVPCRRIWSSYTWRDPGPTCYYHNRSLDRFAALMQQRERSIKAPTPQATRSKSFPLLPFPQQRPHRLSSVGEDGALSSAPRSAKHTSHYAHATSEGLSARERQKNNDTPMQPSRLVLVWIFNFQYRQSSATLVDCAMAS